MSDAHRKTSKFMSLVLRHEPQRIGIALDPAGWVSVEELLAGMRGAGHGITVEQLREIVRSSDKQRFALSEDGQRIRANQGHSVEVELGYTPQVPPEWLWHGTADRFLESIRAKGLIKGSRHHVHLSADERTAAAVGVRHGRLALLRVAAGRMHESGHAFFLSTNGVWLVEHVPPEFLMFPESEV